MGQYGIPNSYDNWKLASPPDEDGPCECGHDYEDHDEDGCPDCDCAGFEMAIPDPCDDGDAAFDAARDDELTD